MEALQLLAAPVRKLRLAPFALTIRRFIPFPGLDIVRNGGGIARIDIAEAYDSLVTSGRNFLQQIIHWRPVIDILLLADIVVEHIGELHLDGIGLPGGTRIPEDNARHRLYARNLGRNSYPAIIGEG